MVRYKTGEMYTSIGRCFDGLEGELLLELYEEEIGGCADWDKHYRKMKFVGVEKFEKFKKARAAFLNSPKRTSMTEVNRSPSLIKEELSDLAELIRETSQLISLRPGDFVLQQTLHSLKNREETLLNELRGQRIGGEGSE